MHATALFYRHILFAFAITLAAFVMSSAHASAQRFQYVYGGPECRDAGRYGVKQLSDGGYLFVGETYSVQADCGISDTYVLRTNPDGSLQWSAAYHIGNVDSATDVIEDQNGDFVVTGVTDNGDFCTQTRDVFIMKIDPNGNLLQPVRTYGYRESDEIAWNIVETESSDYVVVGSTTLEAGAERDGYIVRVDNGLNVIFQNRYHGDGDDYFYGVDEARIDGSGDIVAVGGTNSWAFGDYDVWIVRVDGNSGTFNGAPQGGAVWGHERFDEARAVIEVRESEYRGHFVVTGITESRPSGSSQEVLMLQFDGDPCNRVADQYAGDAGDLRDGGIDLKEDAFPDVEVGGVIVTGFTNFGDDQRLVENAFLQRFEIGSLNITGAGMAYGGDGVDWGWSVNNATIDDPDIAATPGYIVCGFTQSPNLIGNDPEQVYLIKTNTSLESGCNEVAFEFIAEPADFNIECFEVEVIEQPEDCEYDVEWENLDWQEALCYEYPRTRRQGGNENDGVSGVETPAVISFKEGTVISYPNPVTSGTNLNLRFDLNTSAQAHITVTDIVGRVVVEKDATVEAGSALQMIETAGWTSGSYIVRVTIGGVASTTRVVVIEQ